MLLLYVPIYLRVKGGIYRMVLKVTTSSKKTGKAIVPYGIKIVFFNLQHECAYKRLNSNCLLLFVSF